jgi:16S rRNA (cytosine1402-N4)-methyltransferase
MNGNSTKKVLSHRPVLYQEIIQALQPRQSATYIDCTLGAGGHSWGILKASFPDGRLIGLDVDPGALHIARERLAEFGSRVMILQESYIHMNRLIKEAGWKTIMGVVFDLGVSSMQLDNPERGFSFQKQAPLDMRFDPRNPVSAHDLIDNLSEGELADLIYKYGEERKARIIAKSIIEQRPIKDTLHLASVVSKVTGGRSNRPGRQKRHPATRTFQALRIAVNQELASLEKALPIAIDILDTGGRLAVISFHSLEDRIVKNIFRRESKDCICPPKLPVCNCGHRATVRLINRRPVIPNHEEIIQNPRARSARLRTVEKINKLAH